MHAIIRVFGLYVDSIAITSAVVEKWTKVSQNKTQRTPHQHQGLIKIFLPSDRTNWTKKKTTTKTVWFCCVYTYIHLCMRCILYWNVFICGDSRTRPFSWLCYTACVFVCAAFNVACSFQTFSYVLFITSFVHWLARSVCSQHFHVQVFVCHCMLIHDQPISLWNFVFCAHCDEFTIN